MSIKWTGIYAPTAFSTANNKTQDDYVVGHQDTIWVTGPGYGGYEGILRIHKTDGSVVAEIPVTSGGGPFSAPAPVRFLDDATTYSYSWEVRRGNVPTDDASGIVVEIIGGASKRFPSPISTSADGQSIQSSQTVAAPNLRSSGPIRVAYIGASICAQGYLDLAVAYSFGAAARVVNAGIAGQNLSQCVARFDTDITPYKPNEVWISLDPFFNESTTTLDAAKKASVASLIDKTIAIGARPVVFGTTLKPGVELAISVFNNWAKGYCWSRNIEYVELWDNLLIQATGVVDTSKFDAALTHPIWDERVNAAKQYASMRWPSIGNLGYRRASTYLRTNGAAGQNTQVVDPFNTTGTASLAGRWQNGTLSNCTLTPSKVATSLPDIGVWQRQNVALAAVASANGGVSCSAPGMTHTEGDEWLITFRFRTLNMSGLSIDLYIDWQNSGGSSLVGRKSFIPAILGNCDMMPSYILTAPANAWKAQLSAKFTQITNGAAGSGDVDFAMINISRNTVDML